MTQVVVRFKALPHGEGLPLPSYASEQAAGLDLAAALEPGHAIFLAPGERALIPTGIVLELPSGFEGQIRPRSGLALHHGITVLNAPGTIDADYRGEIHVLLINLGSEPYAVERGFRIAQLVVAPIARAVLESADTLPATKRNTGGFGSTGQL